MGKIDLTPTSVIIANLGLEKNGRVQKFFTNDCAKHIEKYEPYDTGTLSNTKEIGDDYLYYNQPYSKIVYYGVRNGKGLNYHTDKHKLAGPYWDKRMWTAEKNDIIQETQRFLERG